MPASLLDPDYQFGASPLPGASSAPTDLLGLGQLQVTPQDQNTDQGAALGQTYQMITDAIARQREQSRQMGLLGDNGLPTGAGVVDAARQYAQGVMLGTTAPGDVPPPGIVAYHGSPHSFDQFDTSKIGTGEGAQAYGHGLYFAGNEGVARGYRDVLAPQHSPDFVNNQQQIADAITAKNAAFSKLRDNGASGAEIDAALAPHDAKLDALYQHEQALKDAGAAGHMYQVNISADPEHFLDWDKPLSEQHPKVQDALDRSGIARQENQPYIKGSDVHSFLSQGERDPAAAAQRLKDLGIPGIRYLDQGSRGAGQGTHNYVVFDAKTIDILRKYGLAGLIAGGGAAATQRQSNAQ